MEYETNIINNNNILKSPGSSEYNRNSYFEYDLDSFQLTP